VVGAQMSPRMRPALGLRLSRVSICQRRRILHHRTASLAFPPSFCAASSLESSAWLKPASSMIGQPRVAVGLRRHRGALADEPRCFVICLFLLLHYQCITKTGPPIRPLDWVCWRQGRLDRRFMPAWGGPNPAMHPLHQSGAVEDVGAGGPWVLATVKHLRPPEDDMNLAFCAQDGNAALGVVSWRKGRLHQA
jgi:hypothetical protein